MPAVPYPPDISEALHLLETEVLAAPLSGTPWIDRVCRHIMAGGKRIRPLLLLLSGAALGADRKRCLHLAGTAEFIHSATLLHDDVIDEAQTRRNSPNVNQLWSTKHGILAGDMLYARAFALIAEVETTAVRRLLAETACALAEAEFLQLEHKADPDRHIDEDRYLRILSGKTASLFRFCCLAPALECGADESMQRALATFGEQFGIAFQLTDDALDCTGNLEETGKLPGADLRDGNLTMPIARALEQADAADRRAIEQALDGDDASEDELRTALQAVLATDAVEYSLNRCKDFVDQAISALPAEGSNIYFDTLAKLAHTLTSRRT